MAYIVFDTPGHKYYVYDRETNRTVGVSAEDADSLHQALQSGESNECLQRYQEKGLCRPTLLEKIEHPCIPYIDQLADSQMEDLLLQVTQNCNLRCEYCAYSGKYYNRVHSSKRMTYEMACQAVDFLFEHSRDKDSVIIGFYGGEPLLEFDLIQRVVAYVEENYGEKNVTFGMTTNGTLLSNEIVEFLVAKHFSIIISLDGPKNQHDQYRRFVNGQGSYDIVMHNIMEIKEKHPHFYKTLRTNTVLTPGKDADALVDFFDTEEALSGMSSMLSMLSEAGNKEKIQYGDDVRIVAERERAKLMLYALGQLDEELVSKTYRRYLDDLIFMCKINQSVGKITDMGHHSGSCMAGIRKTFVDVYGNMYPCEKVGEVPAMKLGNVFTGFDMEQVKRLTNVGVVTAEECKKCWALTHCNICLNQCIEKEDISRKAKLRHCGISKMDALTKIRDLCFLQAEGMDFEKLTDLQTSKEGGTYEAACLSNE